MNIQELINKELQTEQEIRKDRQRSGKFSPSLLGCCYRRQWWNRSNEPISNPINERGLRVFKVGNFFHSWVQGVITKNNPDIRTEVKVEDDNFLGFADVVNGEEVVDIKSVHSKAFWYMEKCQDIAKEKFNNWMQVLFYAQKLGKKYAKLCFISKDDLTISEYRQELDEYWKGQLDEEITKLDYFWKHKVLPPAEPRAYNGKECQYCNFQKTCVEKEMANPSKIKEEK
jgi:CRISPR/Cas system-associated exonuclease Cas4 (RecB family)